MPRDTCCIRGCVRGSTKQRECPDRNENITHFHFPADVAAQKKWIKNINVLNRQEVSLDSWLSKKVCARHFEPDFILDVGLLSVAAVPTIFPQMDPDEGIVEILESGASDEDIDNVKQPVNSAPNQPSAQTPSSGPVLGLQRLAAADSDESSDEEFSVKDPDTIVKLEHIVNTNRIEMITLQMQVKQLEAALSAEQQQHMRTKQELLAITREHDMLTAEMSANGN